jgi:hypothetical protein
MWVPERVIALQARERSEAQPQRCYTTATGSFPLTNDQATQVTGDFSDAIRHTEWKWQFHAAGM